MQLVNPYSITYQIGLIGGSTDFGDDNGFRWLKLIFVWDISVQDCTMSVLDTRNKDASNGIGLIKIPAAYTIIPAAFRFVC